MQQHAVNLKELERRAWRSYHDDGIWDLFLGVGLLAIGLSGVLGSDYFQLVFAAVAVAGFVAGKKFVTAPRMGLVKFGKERKVRKAKTALLLVAAMLLGLVLYTLMAAGGDVFVWMRANPIVVRVGLGLWMLFVFSAMAYWLDFTRLYLIGLAYAVSFTVTLWFGSITTFFVSGALVTAWGLAIFVRFLRRHPLPADADAGR